MNAIKSILVMMELELRRLKHDRTEIYFRAIQPMLWLVIYGPVMGSVKAIPTNGVPYTDYITPGVLIQSTTFVSIFYGLMMVWERDVGILKRLLVTPAPRYSVVVGRSMASGLRSLLQVFIILPVAYIIGVRFLPNPLYFVLALGVIFFSSGGFASVSILVASFMKTRERFMGIGQAIIMPLFFASNALYPVNLMPPILRELSIINPLTYAVDAVRGLLITGDISKLYLDLGVLITFDILMFTLSSLSFRRIIE
ncbi:ABC transporter permease [Hydrogenobacter thermophilus]|uniref:ABC transporter permease n=1 Tax=Hydrogenobacter thermophilus TaxID=940 RepID=UPI0030FCBFFB